MVIDANIEITNIIHKGSVYSLNNSSYNQFVPNCICKSKSITYSCVWGIKYSETTPVISDKITTILIFTFEFSM